MAIWTINVPVARFLNFGATCRENEMWLYFDLDCFGGGAILGFVRCFTASLVSSH